MLERENHITWDEYFMGVALLAAKRSKDPNRQVGACIVKDNKILATGYNGFPTGCNDNEYFWGKREDFENVQSKIFPQYFNKDLYNKHLYVVHAEVNAILNSNFNLKDSTIYVDLFPCNECAKAIIQAGIKEVVYISDEDKAKTSYQAARMMFESADVTMRKLEKTKFIENLINLQKE